MQKYLDLKEFSIYICPSSKRWSHRLMVRTSPFHGGNMGSSPVGITNVNGRYKNLPFFFIFQGFQRVRMFIFLFSGFGKFLRTHLYKSLCFSICWVSSNLVRSRGQLFMNINCQKKSFWRWRWFIFWMRDSNILNLTIKPSLPKLS